MKIRWMIYAAVGILFGVLDFFFQQLVQTVNAFGLRNILILGIWLVPAFPVILHEARITRSRCKAGLACVITWSAAVISYYLWMGVILAFFNRSVRPELHISNSADPNFLLNWQQAFHYDILGGMIEWTPIALVGGFLVGLVVSTVYFARNKPEPHTS